LRVGCCAKAIQPNLEARRLPAVSQYLPPRLHPRLRLQPRRLLHQRRRNLPLLSQQRQRNPRSPRRLGRKQLRRWLPQLLSHRKRPHRSRQHLQPGQPLPLRNRRRQFRPPLRRLQRNRLRPLLQLCIAPRWLRLCRQGCQGLHRRPNSRLLSQACRQGAELRAHLLRRVSRKYTGSRKNRRPRRIYSRSQPNTRRASLRPTSDQLRHSATEESRKSANPAVEAKRF
jgi:hypothetical protein